MADIAFRTATEWVALLADAQRAGRLDDELTRLQRYPLLIVGEVFSVWGEIFGDEIVAAALIDRLVHHAESSALKGDSYRLRDRDLGPSARDD